jgi:hypothetical protein
LPGSRNSVFFLLFLPLPQSPQMLLCCIPSAFRIEEFNGLVCHSHRYTTSESQKGYHKLYVEKLLMMPSGPVSFRGENESSRQTHRGCKPFVIRK